MHVYAPTGAGGWQLLRQLTPVAQDAEDAERLNANTN